MISLEFIPILNPAVVGRIVSGEAVIVLPLKGQVKVLNEVGARIWSLIDGKRTVSDIVSVIYKEFAVSEEEAMKDTRVFLKQLSDREIITLSERKLD
jgi:hypothetical protein